MQITERAPRGSSPFIVQPIFVLIKGLVLYEDAG
jgi:hypothetical protein